MEKDRLDVFDYRNAKENDIGEMMDMSANIETSNLQNNTVERRD